MTLLCPLVQIFAFGIACIFLKLLNYYISLLSRLCSLTMLFRSPDNMLNMINNKKQNTFSSGRLNIFRRAAVRLSIYCICQIKYEQPVSHCRDAFLSMVLLLSILFNYCMIFAIGKGLLYSVHSILSYLLYFIPSELNRTRDPEHVIF